MNRKQFLQTFGATSIALLVTVISFGQSKMNTTISDNYFGKSEKIKNAMINGTIPRDFPSASTNASLKEFKASVKKWIVTNKHLIKREALLKFEKNQNK
jgi:hypothetical protein